ncbi:MAG: hypothetical protein ABJB33_02065 [Gemmatimonadota bacterium]
MRIAIGAAILVACAPGALRAQDFGDSRCVMSVDTVGRYRQIDRPGNLMFYAGGGVTLSCLGTSVQMRSDSLMALNNFRVTYFIGHVHYSDSTIEMTADHGTYLKDGERWEARGNVVTRNLRTNSTLRGPSLDYLRAVPGIRDTVEMYAVGRPRIEYIPQDTTGGAQEPYVIIGDRVRFRGNDRVYAGGRVTIDRSDFAARGDSLRLDTGAGQDGALIGNAQLQGKGTDPYTLTGRRVLLRLAANQLSGVRAVIQARALTSEWDLVADTIDLTIANSQLVQTRAWGDSLRPRGVSPEREIRADSLAIDTPDRLPTEARLFGRGWVGTQLDSVTGERDWLEGDSVVARFAPADSGPTRNVLRQVEARNRARSYYRVADRARPGPPSISYVRGDLILLRMRASGSNDVERVDVRGQVDGVQLQPLPQRPDSLSVDPLRPLVDSLRPNGTR